MKKPKTGNKCVYTHSSRGKVFYVGKGSIRRASTTKGRPAGWYKSCPDLKFKVTICAENLTEEQADKLEEQLWIKLQASSRLANKPILSPGINSLELHSWSEDVLCTKMEIGTRTIDIPWVMLDSFNSPEQPFRAQITINGKTKRLFSKDLENLFSSFSNFALSPVSLIEVFTKSRKKDMSLFIARYAFWIKHGSKRFLKKYANQIRYRETLNFYVVAARLFKIPRLEAHRRYHADCISNPKALSKHQKNLQDFEAGFLSAFGAKARTRS